MSTLSNPAPTAPVRLRTIALPTEHGGWSLLIAPILLGLWMTPSAAGIWLSLSALGAFLTRQPLKLAWGDWRRGKRFPRTIWAKRFALGYGVLAGIAFGAAWRMSAHPFWLPLLLAMPFAVVQFRFDILKQSRAVVAECCGVTAISAVAAAIAQAAGWALLPAALLWLLLTLQATTAIVYVGARLRLARGIPVPRAPALLLHLAALALVGGLAWFGMVGWPVLAGFVLLAVRCGVGLMPRSLQTRAPVVGAQEAVFSLLTVASIALGGINDLPHLL